jgi:hypothetical protein
MRLPPGRPSAVFLRSVSTWEKPCGAAADCEPERRARPTLFCGRRRAVLRHLDRPSKVLREKRPGLAVLDRCQWLSALLLHRPHQAQLRARPARDGIRPGRYRSVPRRGRHPSTGGTSGPARGGSGDSAARAYAAAASASRPSPLTTAALHASSGRSARPSPSP